MAKRRRSRDDVSGADVGLVMSVCLFLILLTFFVLLNSISVIDEIKTRLAIGSLLGAFGSFKGGLSPLSTGESLSPPTAPIVEEEVKLEDLLACMDREIMGRVKIESHEDREVISIDEKALFERDRSRLKSSSYPLLEKLGLFLKDKDYPVEIVGHTDNTPAGEKGFTSNWELSSLMAIQVVRYFVEKGKILPQRLTPRGCSRYKPIASNDTRQSRAKNRRVEIILHFKAPPYTKRIYRKKKVGVFTYKKFDFRLF
jgi:chemotaxis protein MotB